MKMIILNSKILMFTLCCFLLFLAINSTETENKAKGKSHHKKQDFKIRPNLGDINTHYQKTVKPFIETPFIPTEVDSLAEKKRPNYDNISMSNALLVGKAPTKHNKDTERPIMYSTVITGHPTVIRHPTPQPKGIGAHPDTAKAFALSDEVNVMAEKMKKGSYSVPVKYQATKGNNDSMEVPTFMQSKESKLKDLSFNNNFSVKENEPQKFLKDNFNHDVNLLLDNLENKKDKSERITVLIQGKKRLEQDALKIQNTIVSELKELLFAKEVALKLTNLNNYYTTQIKRTALSGLKLSEVITVKELLREKIQKEIQGFRTSSADYSSLDKINTRDIELIMKNIKNQLNK